MCKKASSEPQIPVVGEKAKIMALSCSFCIEFKSLSLYIYIDIFSLPTEQEYEISFN